MQSNKAKISIIIPVYNIAAYLPKCLNSVINQSLTDIEIICINDGSTDNSLQILEQFAAQDSRIRIISQPNQGLSMARNAGIDHAQGEYIMFLDSDDWLDENTAQQLWQVVEKDKEIDFVTFNINLAYANGKITPKYDNSKHLSGKYKLTPKIFRKLSATVTNRLFKKSVLDKFSIRFPAGLLYEDNEFFYKYCLHATYLYHLNAYFYNYFQRENSIMSQSRKKVSAKYTDRLKIFDNIYHYYEKYNKLEQYKKVIKKLYNVCLVDEYNYCAPQHRQEILTLAATLAQNYDKRYILPRLISKLQKNKHEIFSPKTYLFKIKKQNGYKFLYLFGFQIKLGTPDN